eukprot:976338-Pyramimonas_sp.AAC.2
MDNYASYHIESTGLQGRKRLKSNVQFESHLTVINHLSVSPGEFSYIGLVYPPGSHERSRVCLVHLWTRTEWSHRGSDYYTRHHLSLMVLVYCDSTNILSSTNLAALTGCRDPVGLPDPLTPRVGGRAGNK